VAEREGRFVCGIVGYVGTRSASDVVLAGLARLEYRGYDSAGIAVATDEGLCVEKRAGRLANLTAVLDDRPLGSARRGIGHTRWATHGAPTDANAHPHIDRSHRLAVVHNGIIENFAELRDALERRGVAMRSGTDTEVVAHVIAEEYERGDIDLATATRHACRRLRGAYAIAVVHRDAPDVIVGARRMSPLVVGCGAGEHYLASDVSAFATFTRDAVDLGDDQVVELRPDRVTVTHLDGTPAVVGSYRVDWTADAADKGGYDSYMLKEILEQPRAVADTLSGRLDPGRLPTAETGLGPADWRHIDKLVVVGCGTAFHAGLVTKYAWERWTRIPCEVELASEFRSRDPVLDSRTLVLAISQSGETMDTLMAVRKARDRGATVLAVCNTMGSTIPRESDAALFTRAGPEIAVASTKAFLTQLAAGYLVALSAATARRTLPRTDSRRAERELSAVPDKLEKVVGALDPMREIARSLADARSVLFLGRHVGYPVALEGALKVKELAYLHAEGFAAGELKHGPIALVEDGTPVIVVMPSREQAVLHGKVASNIQEVRARGARTIVVAEEGDDAVVPYADKVLFLPAVPQLLQPLLATVPLQVFAYELALTTGCDVDKPRNLAKSVTVE
jgi:glutamine---fructose-6-phosphate transaminase (isomerizing)